MQPTGAPATYDTLIDSAPITSRQWVVIVLCSLLSMLEGFDMQVIAFAAPEIRREWGLGPAELGPVFSAGLLGGVLGGFLIGPLSDRLGPKKVLIGSCLVFSVLTLATVAVTTLFQLGAIRALSGLGLGASVPAIVATLSAYVPRRLRATLVTVAFCVQFLGAMIGSFASAKLMQAYGWQSVFWMGGLLPLLLIPLAMWLIPEPLDYLARSGASDATIRRALARVGRRDVGPIDLTAESEAAGEAKVSAVALFRGGRAAATVLLLITTMVGGMFFYFLANWLPSILRDSGHSLEMAVYGSTALNFGGLFGSLAFARIIDRYGPYRVMALGYLVGACFVAAVALSSPSIGVVLALIAATAFFGLGAQYCIPAATVLLYPAELRGAGIGFVLGFTRIGAVIGPLIGSYILLVGGGPRELFGFAALGALGASVAIFFARRVEVAGLRRAAAG